jgi:hypothetical protein
MNVGQLSIVSIKSHCCRPLLVETVPDDDSMHDGNNGCATSVDTASLTAHRPVVWDLRVVNSDVPNALEDPDFVKYSAPSGFFRVQQLKKVNTGVHDTDDMFSTVSTVWPSRHVNLRS